MPKILHFYKNISFFFADFVFSGIKCYKTREGEYFGTKIHMKSGFYAPYIRDRPEDQLNSADCRLERLPQSQGSYQIAVSDFRACGVTPCGTDVSIFKILWKIVELRSIFDKKFKKKPNNQIAALKSAIEWNIYNTIALASEI